MCQLLGWTTFPRIPFPCVFPLSMGSKGKSLRRVGRWKGGSSCFVAQRLLLISWVTSEVKRQVVLSSFSSSTKYSSCASAPGCVCSAPRVCASFCRLSSFPRSNVTRTHAKFSSSLWDFSLCTWSFNLLVIFPSWPPNWYLTGLRHPCRDGLSSVPNCRSQAPVKHELYIHPDSRREPCPIKEVRNFRDKIPYLLQRDRWKWWHNI